MLVRHWCTRSICWLKQIKFIRNYSATVLLATVVVESSRVFYGSDSYILQDTHRCSHAPYEILTAFPTPWPNGVKCTYTCKRLMKGLRVNVVLIRPDQQQKPFLVKPAMNCNSAEHLLDVARCDPVVSLHHLPSCWLQSCHSHQKF